MNIEKERRKSLLQSKEGEEKVQIRQKVELTAPSSEGKQPTHYASDCCLRKVTTLGELGELVLRRSHHERPERRQGRLGPEKRSAHLDLLFSLLKNKPLSFYVVLLI